MAGEWGFVYFLGNECMPGVYKIGFTTNHPKTRINQLSSATACPLPFELYACFGVEDAHGVEQEIHQRLANYRVNQSREFFKVPASVLQNVFRGYADGYEDFSLSYKLDAECSIEERQSRKDWILDHFYSQCADPIFWPKRLADFL